MTNMAASSAAKVPVLRGLILTESLIRNGN
jgi:hypothetical protein